MKTDRRNRDGRHLCEARLKSVPGALCRNAATVMETGRLLCGVHVTKQKPKRRRRKRPQKTSLTLAEANLILRVPIPEQVGAFTIVEVLGIGSPAQFARRSPYGISLAATVKTSRHIATIGLRNATDRWAILDAAADR